MIEEWRWISRDEHVPRFSGIDRETESECARFDCMFTNVDYALIENEDADTTRARPPPLSVPFLFFQSFHRPPLNGTKTRTKGHCLRQRQRNIL